MSLQQRMYGYSFSAIEKELIFQRENTGFVRRANAAGTVFYLDPSPFLKSPKREIFVALCEPPAEGDLIETTVLEIQESIQRDQSGHYRLNVKCINKWKRLNPAEIKTQKPLLSSQEVLDFFKLSFTGDKDLLEEVSLCSALYAVSSPPISEETGGVNAAIAGKKKQWSRFKSRMQIIPNEFKRPSSDIFYKISEQAEIPKLHSREINLAFLNPEKIPMDIPVVLDVEVQTKKDYNDAIDSLTPMVRGYLLDSLMIQPQIPENLSAHITEKVYDVINDVKSSGSIPYFQNLGTSIPKLTLAFSRLNTRITAGKNDINEVVDLWGDMFYRAKKIVSTQHEVSRLYDRLDDNARRLYIDLIDIFDYDVPVNITEIPNILSTFKRLTDYGDAIEILCNNGLLLKPNNSTIRILNFEKKKINV